MIISSANYEPQKMVLSAGQHAFCGDFIITNFNLELIQDVIGIERDSRFIPRGLQECRLSLDAISTGAVIMSDDAKKPRIRDKRVEDCTIEELLFAVRNKI